MINMEGYTFIWVVGPKLFKSCAEVEPFESKIGLVMVQLGLHMIAIFLNFLVEMIAKFKK